MNITAMSPPVHAQMVRMPEVAEGPGPDRDGDSDDKVGAGTSNASAAVPSGMGTLVNTVA